VAVFFQIKKGETLGVKKSLILIGMVLVLGIAFYWIESGPKQETKASPPARENRQKEIPVETTVIQRGSLNRRLHLTGDIVPEATVDVFSKVSGIMEQIEVEEGDRVKANQVVALMEREEKEAQLQEIRAALDVLRANWAQMESGARPEEIARAEQLVRQTKASWETSLENYTRQKNLKGRGFVSQQRYDEALLQLTRSEAEYRSAKEKLTLLRKGARQEDRDALRAQIRKAEAAVRLAEIHLSNTMIRAPVSGIVSRRFLDQGAHVNTTTPVLRIVAMDRVKVVVQVVEREIAQLMCGASTDIQVDAYGEEVFQGEVACISPTVDPASRTTDVEVEVDNKDHRLKPGMFARVSIVTQRRDGVLLISEDWLAGQNATPQVFVNENGKASRRLVSLGVRGEHHVEVVRGLEVGDEVIIAGQYQLKDGMPVKVIRRLENR
jgi:multidrug efflux pump subunit AcrA (membrane-fusion protein)